jgi:hypothetical protein
MAWSPAPYTAVSFQGATSPLTQAYAGTVGKTYVLFAAKRSAQASVTAVSDDAGNTWTRIDYAPKSGTVGRRIEAWICTPAAPFASVTVTFPADQTLCALVEVSGADGTVNAYAADVRANTTAPAPVTITPSIEGTLVLAAVMANPAEDATITAPAGWLRLGTRSEGPAIAYRTDAPASVPVGVAWTFGTGAGSGHLILALTPAPAGPSGPTVTVWNGSAEVAATVEGIWNGSQIVPCAVESIT